MKKYLSIITLILCVFFTCAFTENQKVYDNADLLTEAQIQELQNDCIELAKEKEVDIIIVTTNKTNGKSSMAYADDFYDENKFGYDKEVDGTGILFLINMQDREIWISTSGEAITYFTDVRIDRMLDEIMPYLASANYYGASQEFLNQVEKYMGVDAVGDDYYYNEGDLDDTIYYQRSTKEVFEDNFIIYLIVSIVAGAIGAFVLVSGSSKGMTAGAATYMDKGSVKVHKEKDKYLRTTTTKRKIETSSGGGGGSSTHTSSSGSTHGGGGRSF